jgi:hypothetical protein
MDPLVDPLDFPTPEFTEWKANLPSEIRGNLNRFVSGFDQTTSDYRSRVDSVAAHNYRAQRLSAELADRVSVLQRYAEGLRTKHNQMTFNIQTFWSDCVGLNLNLEREEQELNGLLEKVERSLIEIARDSDRIRSLRASFEGEIARLSSEIGETKMRTAAVAKLKGPPQVPMTSYVEESVALRKSLGEVENAICKAEARIRVLVQKGASAKESHGFPSRLEQYRGKVGLLKHEQQRVNTEKVMLNRAIELKRTLIEAFRNGVNEWSDLQWRWSELVRERKTLDFEVSVQRKEQIALSFALENDLRDFEVDAYHKSDYFEKSLRLLKDRIADQNRISGELHVRANAPGDDLDAAVHEVRGRFLRNEARTLAEITGIERANTELRDHIGIILNQRELVKANRKMSTTLTREEWEILGKALRSQSQMNHKVLRDQINGLTTRIESMQTGIVAKRRSLRCKESDIELLISQTRRSFVLSDSGESRLELRRTSREEELTTHVECLEQTAKLLQRGRELSLEPVSLGLWNSQLEAVLSSVCDQLALQSVRSLLFL